MINNNSQKAYSILAKCLINLGKNEEAIQIINKGLSIKPNRNLLTLQRKLEVLFYYSRLQQIINLKNQILRLINAEYQI
jgi:tetratricopeptide (TPR) repeat protein